MFSYISVCEESMDGSIATEDSESGIQNFVLIIEKETRFTSIYISGIKNIRDWLSEISHFCIQKNFHQNFKANKKLGEGAFG